MPEKIPQVRKHTLLQRAKSLVLRTGCEVLVTLSGKRKQLQEAANTLQYRTEHANFPGIPEALRGVKILFLTDPHIGGNIDALATEISTHIHTLLDNAHPEKTLILHGGDFVCSEPGVGMTTEAHFLEVSTKLFHGLSGYPQFGVIGNHDHENHHFDTIRSHLEKTHEITLLEPPEDFQTVTINGATLLVHGIHTLATLLHHHTKLERDRLLDSHITSLNAAGVDCNIVLLHNPDGLEFLLHRLQETGKTLEHPTLFLAGHTHGGMLDVPILRQIGLVACRTRYGRYKGWYGPQEGYAYTGNWKLYVSTGMGNSRGFAYRLNAEPEVVMFTL